jgi:CRP/FNR family transcriptional activator FtrB
MNFLREAATMKPDLEALRSLPLLKGLPVDSLAALREAADLVGFGPDEEVFRAGDTLDELLILVNGQIGTTRPRPAGHPELVDVLLPVQPLCLPAVLLGLPAPIGAGTLSTGRLIALPAKDVREMIAGVSDSARPFFDHALWEAHTHALELWDLKLRSASQRLAHYLLGFIEDPKEEPARFVLPFTRELLAAKIGCTQENLSRAFAALRRIGVQTYQGGVIVSDIPALAEVASAHGRPEMRGRSKLVPLTGTGDHQQ